MKRFFLLVLIIIGCFAFAQSVFAQIPTAVLVQIVRAEDERRFDSTLEDLMRNADAKIRVRAALAAGRIGDENAVPALVNLLKDNSVEVQTMAMFALGETESAKASEAILDNLKPYGNDSFRARTIEAAGKIAAANPKDTKTLELGRAVVAILNQELNKNSAPSYEVILLGETATLRARPEGGEQLMIKLLRQPNARIRADALNTLARLRSKNANAESRELLQKDSDPIVRANAARMLGVGEDKTAIDLLLNAATKDSDSRVRVSAIRSLGSLKDASVTDKLLFRSTSLPIDLETSLSRDKCYYASRSIKTNPLALLECDFDSKSEMLEIATTLSRLLPNTNNEKALEFLNDFSRYDNYQSPEIEIALARVAPAKFGELQKLKTNQVNVPFQAFSATFQGIGELANAPDSEEIRLNKEIGKVALLTYIERASKANLSEDKALPDALTAYTAFKTENLSGILLLALNHKDAIVRAAVAGLLAEQKSSKENVEALKSAFAKSLLTDKHENDAQLAILDALAKLDKKSSVGTFLVALDTPDYLVRKKVFDILSDKDLQKDFPGIQTSLENAKAKKKNQVLPFAAYTGTKLGQILNSQADYVRAVSRKNGSVKAILTTTKGNFTIDFFPEDAPLTVDNFVKLARSNYFNGVEVHRVVPNFVMQDGDPRGDGNGGPGWEIRCEINMLPFDRGAVGMALSGKDTGGSQWFITHSPQPHLDGGYTIFGKVNETDMKIVDSIVRGDKILSVKIIETGLPQRSTKKLKK